MEPVSTRLPPTAAAMHGSLRSESAPVQWLLIGVAVAFLAIFLVLPLFTVFQQAFSHGLRAYFEALADPDARAAIRLTLLVAAVSVAANVVFGLVAAWAITRFEF